MMITTTNEDAKMLHDLDEPNSQLSYLAEQGIIEPMVEPIDDPSLEVNYWDWAEVIGIVDNLVPEEYAV
jgi:hypothetical protein